MYRKEAFVTARRLIGDEEKRMQKREAYSIKILLVIMQGAVTNKDVTNYQCKSLVNLAVEMADALLEKLYPIKEQKLKEQVCASDVCPYRGKNVCTIIRKEDCPMFKPMDEY